MAKELLIPTLCLDDLAGDGWGEAINVESYKNIIIQLATADSPAFDVKIAGSVQASKPDFSAAADKDNHWDYVSAYDLEDPSTLIDGDSGITYSGTADCRLILVNTDFLRWINLEIDNHSAGEANAKVAGSNDA